MADVSKVFVVVAVLVGMIPAMAKLVIGSVYIDDCPYENKVPLPIVLIVSGSLSSSVLAVFQNKIKCVQVVGLIGLLFAIAWNICGCLWLYSSYNFIVHGCPGTQNCNITALLANCPDVSKCLRENPTFCQEVENCAPEYRLGACEAHAKCCDGNFAKFALAMSVIDWFGLLALSIFILCRIKHATNEDDILVSLYDRL